MADGDKYITFKRDEFFQLLGELGAEVDISSSFTELEVKDAVVIRRQDVFAPIPLESYANSVRLAISLAEKGPVSDRLQGMADYFYEQATLSWTMNRKLPD